MTLHELAERIGVETHRGFYIESGDPIPRPDLEIAHDMLAKLPMKRCGLHWGEKQEWDATWNGDHGWETVSVGTFIECVCELAERHIGERK